MFRIDGPNTVPTKPAYGAAGTQGWFKNYGVGGTLDGPGTIVTPDFLNMLQAELLAIVTAAGLTPDKANDAQILAAFDSRYVSVDIGDFIITGRDTPRANELRPNGAAISRTTYAALYAKYGERFGAGNGTTTFNMPNLEGEFIRIFDNGRGIDAGRVLGTSQLDAFQGHAHQMEFPHGVSGTPGFLDGNNASNNGVSASVGIVTLSGYAAPRVAQETRPRNVALNAFVRFI